MDKEEEIIAAIIQGDEKAFAILYQIHSSKVYNIALSYAKDAEIAQDITQEVFVKIYKNAEKFKGKSTLSTWIYRIAVNSSLNHLKKKKRFVLFGSSEDKDKTPDFNHPGVLMENKEKAATLYKAIEGLPDSQKTAFILSYIEELPRQEVADVMETSLKAVESLLQRAKATMRKKLENLNPSEGN